MSGPRNPEGGEGPHPEAPAAESVTVNQAGRDQYIAGRDQHIHYSAGARWTFPGGDNADVGCPYPGLASFTREQAALFFGRARLTADLVGQLDACLTRGGPVMVVAASGAGKSSLLRAGLLPKVAAGALTPTGSRHWPQVVFTPGAHPMHAASEALLRALPGGDSARRPFDPGTRDLDDLLGATVAAAGPGARAVLVVDQFEELFQLCEDEDERGAFISWLWQAAHGEGPGGPTVLAACAVRADFYPVCTRYPQIRQALQDSQIIVGAMSPEELREAITCPAEAVGLDIEPGLTELLLADLRATFPAAAVGHGNPVADDGAGRLPLLAHALQVTWQQRHGSTLTVDGYRASGGIEHAIAESAERIYRRLDAGDQQAAKGLFLRLVKIGATGGEDVRRPIPGPVLAGAGGRAKAVIDAYTAARLLTQSLDTVQITHEALLSAWPRLRDWLEEDRAGNLLRQQLGDDATTWERSGYDNSALLRGTRLDAALSWASDRLDDGGVSPVVRRFLRESRRQQARAGHIRRAAVAVLAVVALVAATTAWFAVRQRSAAEASSQEAILDQVTAEADQAASTDSSLAAELDAVAYQMKPSNALSTKLISAQDTPLATVLPVAGTPDSVAFSPTGDILAAATGTGVQLWSVSPSSAPRPLGSPLPVGSGPADSVAFSPKGDILAAATGAGVQLWILTPASVPRSLGPFLAVGSGAADSIAFSPNGDTLAVATGTGVQLWNLSISSNPGLISTLSTSQAGTVSSVAFSPDGRTLAVGASSLQLWNVASPANPRVSATIAPLGYFSGHLSPFLSVAFSPDGHLLAAGAADAKVHLWGVTNPAQPVSFGLTGYDSDDVTSVAFSPDGDLLATGSADHTAYLDNVTNPHAWFNAYPALTGHTAAILSVAMSPDGSILATASADHTIRLWHLPSTVLIGHSGYVNGLVLDPSRHILVSSSGDNTMRLWNIANPAAPTPISGPILGPGDFDGLSIRPDGRLFAVGAQNTVQLWQLSNPVHPTRIGPALPGAGPNTSGSYVASMAFSSDGRTLAVGSFNRTVQLWNVSDPADPVPLGSPLSGFPAQGVNSVSFSPDGRTLAVGGTDGKIRLWDVTDPVHAVPLGTPLTGSTGSVEEVVFSPNGQTLATGDSVGTVKLWDVKDPARASMVGQPPTGQTSTIYSLAFSPDGHTLASGSLDYTIRLWNVADPSHPQEIGDPLTGDTGSVNTLVFGAGGHVLIAGDGSYAVRIWNLDAATAIQRICAATANVLTPAQWHQYVPELPYNPPCGTSQ
jgi:WD40 repeat protein